MVAFLPDAFEAFVADEDDTPVVMLNLLRFKPDGGRQRYLDYLAMAKPILARFGARILFGGDGLPPLATDAGASWDAVLLVFYPRRAAFATMVADPAYQEAFKVGASAIDEIHLQPLKDNGAEV